MLRRSIAALALLLAWIAPQLELSIARSPWKSANATTHARGQLRWEHLPVPPRAAERARSFGDDER